MAQVFDFKKNMEERDRVRQQNKETEKQIAFFMNTFGDQSKEVINKIWVAINSGDLEEYKRITEPIILRKAIKEFN